MLKMLKMWKCEKYENAEMDISLCCWYGRIFCMAYLPLNNINYECLVIVVIEIKYAGVRKKYTISKLY
jgi:hypothetical protein